MARQVHDTSRPSFSATARVPNVEEATRHKAFIVEQLERLNSAGQAEFASKLLELSGKAEPEGLARVKAGR